MKRKLPQSLTTVTTFSKILAVLLFFIFVLGAFREGMRYQQKIDGIKDAPQTVITVMPTQEVSQTNTTIITELDNGKTEYVHSGDRVLVQLEGNWRDIALSNNAVLQPSPDGVFYTHTTQGRYKAVQSGTVTLSAQEIEGCTGKNGMMCPEYLVFFKTTIVVN